MGLVTFFDHFLVHFPSLMAVCFSALSGLSDTAVPHLSVPPSCLCPQPLPVAAVLETGTARRAPTHWPVLLNSALFPVCWGAEALKYFETVEKTQHPAKPIGCSQRQAFPMPARYTVL